MNGEMHVHTGKSTTVVAEKREGEAYVGTRLRVPKKGKNLTAPIERGAVHSESYGRSTP